MWEREIALPFTCSPNQKFPHPKSILCLFVNYRVRKYVNIHFFFVMRFMVTLIKKQNYKLYIYVAIKLMILKLIVQYVRDMPNVDLDL